MDIIGRWCSRWRLAEEDRLKLLWRRPIVDIGGRQFSSWRLA